MMDISRELSANPTWDKADLIARRALHTTLSMLLLFLAHNNMSCNSRLCLQAERIVHRQGVLRGCLAEDGRMLVWGIGEEHYKPASSQHDMCMQHRCRSAVSQHDMCMQHGCRSSVTSASLPGCSGCSGAAVPGIASAIRETINTMTRDKPACVCLVFPPSCLAGSQNRKAMDRACYCWTSGGRHTCQIELCTVVSVIATRRLGKPVYVQRLALCSVDPLTCVVQCGPLALRVLWTCDGEARRILEETQEQQNRIHRNACHANKFNRQAQGVQESKCRLAAGGACA